MPPSSTPPPPASPVKPLGDLRALLECDLNPVKALALGQGCVALDARIRIG